MPVGEALQYAELVLASIAILAVLKSAYNGYLRATLDAIKALPDIAVQVDRLTDVVMALVVAENVDDASIHPGAAREHLNRERDIDNLIEKRDGYDSRFPDGGRPAEDD